MINFEKIRKECPKAWDLLKIWVRGKIQEMKTKIMQGAPNASEESLFPEINDILVESTISWQPRALYDFFDMNNIKVFIYDVPETGKFIYYINSSENEGPYNNRIECETAAFGAAFNWLEGTL